MVQTYTFFASISHIHGGAPRFFEKDRISHGKWAKNEKQPAENRVGFCRLLQNASCQDARQAPNMSLLYKLAFLFKRRPDGIARLIIHGLYLAKQAFHVSPMRI